MFGTEDFSRKLNGFRRLWELFHLEHRRRLLAIAAIAGILSACAGEPRPAIPSPQGTPVTVGDWEVTTGGRVRVEGGYVGS